MPSAPGPEVSATLKALTWAKKLCRVGTLCSRRLFSFMTTLARLMLVFLYSVTLSALTEQAVAKPDARAVEAAVFDGAKPTGAEIHPLTIKTQILLDRAGFSPGEIDGKFGENVGKALRAYASSKGLNSDTALTPELFALLTKEDPGPLLLEVRLKESDVRGPFLEKQPKGMDEMKGIKRLSFRDAKEAMAEKYHMSEELLRALNPSANFKTHTKLIVANVVRSPSTTVVTRIEVDKKLQTVRAFSKDDALVAFYPATVGSEEKPSPGGTLTVRAVRSDPHYRYNPDYKFKGVKSRRAFTINPGPNNPVGSTWIALSEEGYGIHGTPFPAKVSKAESNGCVRLTNWDAADLARMLKPGVTVKFHESDKVEVRM